MALRYVRSGAAGAANGTNWANAYLTLAAACSAAAAGDTIYVAADHNESSASAITLNPSGSATAPVKVICVDHTGSVPPVSADLRTTAAVSTTGAANIVLSCDQTYFEGIIFTAGNGASNATITVLDSTNRGGRIKNCSLRLGSTNNSALIHLGTSSTLASMLILDNVTFQFSHASQMIWTFASLVWKNTASAILGATLPTTLFSVVTASRVSNILLQGVDLSALGSGKTLFNCATSGSTIFIRAVDCKIDSAVTIANRQVSRGAGFVELHNVAGDSATYRRQLINYEGTLTEEATIVRTGGASNGVTSFAWKIVTTANANPVFPFNCPPIVKWNSTTGSAKTLTIEGIWGGGAVPNNDEVWVEVQYLGNGSYPIASFIHDSIADSLAAAAGQASSSVTWGGSTTKFKLEVTFTPQMKGWIMAVVKIGKASATMYIDPKVTLS